MPWVKRNLYFLISCVLALALLIGAGWYCYTGWQNNSDNLDKLTQAINELTQINNKQPGAGDGEKVDNIKTARDEAGEAQKRAQELGKFLAAIPPIPNTNKIEDQALASSVREMIRQLRLAAVSKNVGLPPDYAFSFSAQREKATYAGPSLIPLSKQLGEVSAICDVLFQSRILSLESLQRERTVDDANAAQTDYLDTTSVTNNGTVITPYQITFHCFTPELANVLAGFANRPYGMVVTSLVIAPEDMTPDANTTPPPGTVPGMASTSGGLPLIVDERKLKVTMLLEIIKMNPGQGR
jgi:hypothetical protein